MGAFTTWLTGLTSKTTPVAADELYLRDSEDAGASKKLTWANLKAAAGAPGGSTTQVQYNNAGAFAGSAGFTYNDSTKTLSLINGVDTLTLKATGGYECQISGGTYGIGFTGNANYFGGTANSNGNLTMGIGYDGLYFGRHTIARFIKYRDSADDGASSSLSITGQNAAPSAVTYLTGGAINITGGAGASSSAGVANGGNVVLEGGTGYGTGTKGIVTASRLKASGFATAIAAKTADYTITNNDGALTANCTSAAVAFTLPPLASCTAGQEHQVIKIDAVANAMTLDGNASEPINGSTSALSTTTQWGTFRVKVNADKSGWLSF